METPRGDRTAPPLTPFTYRFFTCIYTLKFTSSLIRALGRKANLSLSYIGSIPNSSGKASSFIFLSSVSLSTTKAQSQKLFKRKRSTLLYSLPPFISLPLHSQAPVLHRPRDCFYCGGACLPAKWPLLCPKGYLSSAMSLIPLPETSAGTGYTTLFWVLVYHPPFRDGCAISFR